MFRKVTELGAYAKQAILNYLIKSDLLLQERHYGSIESDPLVL